MYFELKLAAVLPDHIYLHARKSSADMQAWYLKYGVADSYTTNDVTGWDTGCDEGTMHFDVRVMQSFGMPVFFTDAYCARKLNCRTFLGDFPVMQASGDRWTWTLNTVRNIAIMHVKFSIAPGTPLCFSGDDFLAIGYLHIRASFRPSDWKFKFKIERGRYGDFCGFVFGGPELSVSALQLYARARILAARGPDLDSVTNYLGLCALYTSTTPQEDEYHAHAVALLRSLKIPRTRASEFSRRSQQPAMMLVL